MLTNLCRVPSSVRTWPAMPGYSATSLERTSPIVAPSTLTTDDPPAWLRRTVGRRTSTATGPPRSVSDGAPAVHLVPRRLAGTVAADHLGGRQQRLVADAVVLHQGDAADVRLRVVARRAAPGQVRPADGPGLEGAHPD